MATGIQANGTDLDALFDLYVSGTQVSPTGILYGGVDIASRYQPLAAGFSSQGPVCGIQSNGTDLSALFGQAGTTVTTQQTTYATSFTTTWTTTYPTSYSTNKGTSRSTSKSTSRSTSKSTVADTYVSTLIGCVVSGTKVRMADDSIKLVDDLVEGDEVRSVILPGLQPETAEAYTDYQEPNLDGAERGTTVVQSNKPLAVVEVYELTWEGSDVTLRMTGDHPLLIRDASGTYRISQTRDLTTRDYVIDKDLNPHSVIKVEKLQVNDTVFRVDCAPYDLFIQNELVGHNEKPGGNQYDLTAYQTTITTTYTTSWTTSFTTSFTTAGTTSVNTSHSTSVTTSRNTTRTTDLTT